MIRPVISTAAVAALVCLAQPAASKQLGSVQFETSCKPAAQKLFNQGMIYQHSFWYRASQRTFEDVLKADPKCAMAYWGIALSLLYNPHAPPPPENLPLGLDAVQKGKALNAQTERERDYIEAISAMYVDHDKVDHRTRVQRVSQGHGASRAAISEGRRGADRLRDHAQRRGFSGRQDLRQPAQGCGAARADLQEQAAASRRRALPDPSLRLSGDRRERPCRGQALRHDRGGRPARPAHAVAHLHARRLLEGIDQVERRVGARRQARRRDARPGARHGLHGLCPPATRAGQEGARRDRRDEQGRVQA